MKSSISLRCGPQNFGAAAFFGSRMKWLLVPSVALALYAISDLSAEVSGMSDLLVTCTGMLIVKLPVKGGEDFL